MLLTPREVASTLRVDLSTVYRMIDRGTLAGVQFGESGHTVRIPAAELCASLPLKPAAGGATSTGAASPRGGLEGEAA